MVILTIILVPLIALSFDHKNHSKWHKSLPEIERVLTVKVDRREPNGPARSKVAQPKRTDGNTHLSQTLSLSSHPHPSASRPSGRRRRPPPPPPPPSSVLIAWTSASTAAAGALLHLPLIVDFPPSRSKHAASCLSLRRRRPSKRQMRHCRQSS